VVGGVVFWAFNLTWTSISTAVSFFPPLSALFVGVWLFPAVLGGLLIRKPGAAVYTELVAAVVSAFAGNQWGFSTVWYGLVEGLGAEVVFALLLYRAFGLPAALGAGAGAGLTVGLMDTLLYQPTFSPGWKLTYIGFAIVSGVVVAGLGSWLLARGLARTGALAALPSGRAAERV
jgi:energy-coupling factor transport system substrate-specific component